METNYSNKYNNYHNQQDYANKYSNKVKNVQIKYNHKNLDSIFENQDHKPYNVKYKEKRDYKKTPQNNFNNNKNNTEPNDNSKYKSYNNLEKPQFKEDRNNNNKTPYNYNYKGNYNSNNEYNSYKFNKKPFNNNEYHKNDNYQKQKNNDNHNELTRPEFSNTLGVKIKVEEESKERCNTELVQPKFYNSEKPITEDQIPIEESKTNKNPVLPGSIVLNNNISTNYIPNTNNKVQNNFEKKKILINKEEFGNLLKSNDTYNKMIDKKNNIPYYDKKSQYENELKPNTSRDQNFKYNKINSYQKEYYNNDYKNNADNIEKNYKNSHKYDNRPNYGNYNNDNYYSHRNNDFDNYKNKENNYHSKKMFIKDKYYYDKSYNHKYSRDEAFNEDIDDIDKLKQNYQYDQDNLIEDLAENLHIDDFNYIDVNEEKDNNYGGNYRNYNSQSRYSNTNNYSNNQYKKNYHNNNYYYNDRY